MIKGRLKHLKDKGYWQLLAKYVCVILIPLMLLTPAVGLALKNGLIAEQARGIDAALTTAQNQLDYTLGRVYSFSVGIDRSDGFVSSMLNFNAYSRVAFCKLLYNYASLDAMYAGLCAFSPQTPDLIYTRSGTELISNLKQYGCFEGGVAPASLFSTVKRHMLFSNLAATDGAPLRASQLRRDHSWLYVCPAGVFQTASITAMLRINTWTFYSAYGDFLDRYDAGDYAMITLDDAGRVIGMAGALYDDDALISPSWLQAELQAGTAAAFRKERGNYTNVLLMNQAILVEAVRPQMQIMWLSAAAVLLFALFGCAVAAGQSYRPIVLLRESILAGISEMPVDPSELRDIDHSIAKIIRTYNQRAEQSRHIREMMRRQLIYWALLNNLPRTQHIEQLLSTTDLNQPNMLFCALAVRLPASPEPELIDNLISEIEQMDWNHSGVTALWIASHDTLAAVFHMFVELDTRARQEYAANALNMVLDQYGISACIGVGMSQPTLYTLSHSYTTARRAMSEAAPPYCLFEDIQISGNNRFSGCLQNLIAHINEGRVEDARAELERYLRLLGEISARRLLFQFHTARLLNDLSGPLVEMGIWSFAHLDGEIERLMFMNLGELSEALNALLGQIGANSPVDSADEEQDDKNHMLSSVRHNLEENALNPMLNINLEAERFGISTVTLNRRFRQRYGRTMVNFVSEIRMEKAKELLRTSDMRIKDVVTAVGYYDVPNFTRKFKALVGMTPGQYRQQERGDAAEDVDAD